MTKTDETPAIGRIVEGYEIPVINERAVRAAAGILLLIGGIAFGYAAATGSADPLKPFGFLFVIDMGLRVTLGDRWSPTLALGRLIVIRQKPEWVGASQKAYAWWLGFGLAIVNCGAMGYLGAPLALTLSLCGVCLAMLYLETAFGICVGCSLQRLLTRKAPQYCPGGTCDVQR